MGKQYTVLEMDKESVRIIAGIRADTHGLIQHAHTHPLPPNVWEQGRYRPDVLGPFLADLCDKLAISNRRAVACLTRHNLLSRVLHLPTPSGGNLSPVIDRYVRENLPQGTREFAVDYTILERDAAELTVRLNLAQRDLVQSLYDSIRRASMKPVALIPPACALNQTMRLATRINQGPAPKAHAFGLLHFSSDGATLSLFHGGHLHFSRSVQTGMQAQSDEYLDTLCTSLMQLLRSVEHMKLGNLTPERYYLSGTAYDPLRTRELLEERLERPVDVLRSLSTVQYEQPQPGNVLLDLVAAGCLLSLASRFQDKQTYCDLFQDLP